VITTASGHSIAVTSGNRHKIDSVPVVFIHGVMVTYQFMTHVMTNAVANDHQWFSMSLPAHAPSTTPAAGRSRHRRTRSGDAAAASCATIAPDHSALAARSA
jgi:hypothetical protein